ncbi:MAG: MGMT family protein [Bacteroidales bacterium]|nr:MGMT family protein [Bacteroidales bacterium]
MKNEESLISLKIYDIVRNIPRGEVMTYGQIAEMLGE